MNRTRVERTIDTVFDLFLPLDDLQLHHLQCTLNRGDSISSWDAQLLIQEIKRLRAKADSGDDVCIFPRDV